MPLKMHMGCQQCQQEIWNNCGNAQCIEFLEWQSTINDFKEMTKKYKSELKANKNLVSSLRSLLQCMNHSARIIMKIVHFKCKCKFNYQY
jgi:hypothetical protein